MPFGIYLGSRIGFREASNELSGTSVEHVPKFRKYRFPFIIDFLAEFRVFLGLLLLEIKLLTQELLLKAKGKPCREPTSEKCSENGSADSNKQKLVTHKGDIFVANVVRQPRPLAGVGCTQGLDHASFAEVDLQVSTKP